MLGDVDLGDEVDGALELLVAEMPTEARGGEGRTQGPPQEAAQGAVEQAAQRTGLHATETAVATRAGRAHQGEPGHPLGRPDGHLGRHDPAHRMADDQGRRHFERGEEREHEVGLIGDAKTCRRGRGRLAEARQIDAQHAPLGAEQRREPAEVAPAPGNAVHHHHRRARPFLGVGGTPSSEGHESPGGVGGLVGGRHAAIAYHGRLLSITAARPPSSEGRGLQIPHSAPARYAARVRSSLLIATGLVAGCNLAAGLTDYAFDDGSGGPGGMHGGAGAGMPGGAGGVGPLGGMGGAGGADTSTGGIGGTPGGTDGMGGDTGPACGNGLLEPPEECDDGDTNNGDGCDESCLVVCDQGGIKRDLTNHCYWKFGDDRSWNEALVACQALGGGAHLATITNNGERDFVDDIVDPDAKYWLGGHDFALEGTFVWITGEAFPTDLWNDGEPNNGGIGSEQDCVSAYADNGESNDDFDDESCDDELDSVCERAPAGK